MNVGGAVKRQRVIYHVSKPFYIDSPCGNVGCDKDSRFFRSEPREDFFPLALRNISVQRRSFVAALIQKTRNGIRVGLGLRKYQTVKIGRNIYHAHQGFNLFAFAHKPIDLLG